MSDLNEYKCPACGAPIRYDITKESMTCRFCNNTFDLEYINSHIIIPIDEKLSDFDWVERSTYVWEPYELDRLEEFHCPSCDGKIVTKAFYATSKCPFCKNYVIISSDLDGDIRPDKVISFKVPQELFWDKYKEYISGFKKIPEEFKSKDIRENIVGCYIPVWSYSCTYTPVPGKSLTVKEYPVLANDADIDGRSFYSLLPYDFSESEDFTESCLTGSLASRYIIGAENAIKSTDLDICSFVNGRHSAISGLFEKNWKKDTDTRKKLDKLLSVRLNEKITNRKLSYYLVPLWLLNINYNGEKFTYAMNGQTGKLRVDKMPKITNPNLDFWIVFSIIHLILVLGTILFIRFSGKEIEDCIQIIIFLFMWSMVNLRVAVNNRKDKKNKKINPKYYSSKLFKRQKIQSIKDYITWDQTGKK